MLGKLGTLLKWLILLPVLIAVLLLAVANDHTVTVHLNPFDTSDPFLRLDAALYQIAFAMFVIGVLAGGLIVWTGQLRQRGRNRRREEARWQTAHADGESRHGNMPSGHATAYLPRPERG